MILHETRSRWFPTLVSELLLPREFGVDLTGKDRRGGIMAMEIICRIVLDFLTADPYGIYI